MAGRTTSYSYSSRHTFSTKSSLLPPLPPAVTDHSEDGACLKWYTKVRKWIWPSPSFVYCHVCNKKGITTPATYKDELSTYRCENCDHIFSTCDQKEQKFLGDERQVTCGQVGYEVSTVWLVVACILYIFMTLCQNVGVIMMGYRMPPYAEFLNYGPQFASTLFLALCAIITRESFFVSWKEHIQFLWLGIFSSINGVLAQFAIPFVAAEITTLLNQCPIPLIWISSYVMFRWSITPFRLIMFVLILLGLATGVVPSIILGSGGGGEVHTSIFWALVTIGGQLPVALLFTFQERVFKELGSGMWVTLTYLNFYTCIAYVCALPLTMVPYFGSGFTWDEMWENQWQAFQCFFGFGEQEGLNQIPAGVPGSEISKIPCQPLATTWVCVFTFGFLGTYIVGAGLMKARDSNLIANLVALCTPLQAVVFWCHFLVGNAAQQPVSWIIISALVISVSDLLYERYSDPVAMPKDFIGRFMTESKYGKWLSTGLHCNCFCKKSEQKTDETVEEIIVEKPIKAVNYDENDDDWEQRTEYFYSSVTDE